MISANIGGILNGVVFCILRYQKLHKYKVKRQNEYKEGVVLSDVKSSIVVNEFAKQPIHGCVNSSSCFSIEPYSMEKADDELTQPCRGEQ